MEEVFGLLSGHLDQVPPSICHLVRTRWQLYLFNYHHTNQYIAMLVLYIILIDAGNEKVWKNTNSLAAMDRWSPWNARDPNMETTLTGVDGQSGA